jgi:hypothetical protein
MLVGRYATLVSDLLTSFFPVPSGKNGVSALFAEFFLADFSRTSFATSPAESDSIRILLRHVESIACGIS